MKKLFFYILFIILITYSCFAQQNKPVFSTWEGFEPDKCASIWLIKRFIEPDAEIKFFPKGTINQEGILFDTPHAKFRRYHNMSTFESMLRYYKIEDPKLIYIGKIIHDIEINYWGTKMLEQTQEVDEAVKQIILKFNKQDIIIKSLHYFDLLYKNLQLP